MNNKQWEAQQAAKKRKSPTPPPEVADGEATESVTAKVTDRPRPVDREIHFQYVANMFSCG